MADQPPSETWVDAVILISCACCAFVLLFTVYTFYRRRNQMGVVKRHGNLVIAYTICAIIWLAIGRPLKGLYLDMIGWPVQIIVIVSYHMCSYLALCRYWLIYFDIKFVSSLNNLEWKQCITKNLTALKNETWYIQNRGSFGNPEYMVRRTVLVVAVISTALVAIAAVWPEYLDAALVFEYLVFFIVFCIIWHQMPMYNDNIYLSKEFSLTARIYVVGWFGLALIVFLRLSNYIEDAEIISFFVFCGKIFAIFTLTLLATYWMPKYLEKDRYIHLMNESEHLSLETIFNDPDALLLFMKYFLDSFAIECLLFLIEAQQFKSYVIEKLGVDHNPSKDAFYLKLPQHIPKSDIMCRDDGDEVINIEPNSTETETNDKQFIHCKQKGLRLYDKYVKCRSQFEVNLSSKTKCRIQSVLFGSDAVTQETLITVFDGACGEIMTLVNDARYRFKYDKLN